MRETRQPPNVPREFERCCDPQQKSDKEADSGEQCEEVELECVGELGEGGEGAEG